MPIINANIAGNEHSFFCAEGEEEKFRSLAHKLNTRIEKVTKGNPKASEIRIMVLVSLLMEDEIDDLKKNKAIEASVSGVPASSDETIVRAIDSISEYLENLAKKVESL
jgi:cell division protein ZapA (FtsZ GTPase activity inhibitor)